MVGVASPVDDAGMKTNMGVDYVIVYSFAKIGMFLPPKTREVHRVLT